MELSIADFNGADRLFRAGEPKDRWDEIEKVLRAAPLFLQPSTMRGKRGLSIFDPKAMNRHLTAEVKKVGWDKVPLPGVVGMFGDDWDAGKGSVVAEWQFSNYPFLWNNVVRTELAHRRKLKPLKSNSISGLIQVTRMGCFPASNSTLYFEQAKAQLSAVFKTIPIQLPVRLVGLGIATNARSVKAYWSAYAARYGRNPDSSDLTDFKVGWGGAGKYGNPSCTLELES